MNIKKYCKFILKLHIKIIKFSNKIEKIEYNEFEKSARSIIVKLVNELDSDLWIDPETNERFIVNKRLNTSIIISEGTADFFGDYLHTVIFNPRNQKAIIQIFNKHASIKRNILKSKISTKVKTSFDEMYESVVLNH